MADHTAPHSPSFTDSNDCDEELSHYSYPWETESAADDLQVAQESLNEWIQSPEDGWHKVHYPAVHKAEGGPFHGNHLQSWKEADKAILDECLPSQHKRDWQAHYKQKGITT